MQLFQILLLAVSWSCIEPKVSNQCGPNPDILRFTSKLKKLVCDKHNVYRNNIASGTIRGFSPAARMATIQWSKELAELAQLNVCCEMHKANCTKTHSLPFVGQNLGSSINYRFNKESLLAYLKSQILEWYNEYESATMEMMKSYPDPSESIEHFAQLIKDGANYVGCALIRVTSFKYYKFYLACNYAQGIKPNESVYESSDWPTSACKMGHDVQFVNLCAKNESYNILSNSSENTN